MDSDDREAPLQRIPLTVVIYKKRSEVDHELADRDAADHENLCAEFLPISTTLRILNVRRRSKAVQVAAGQEDRSTQTTLSYPRHANVQYEARYLQTADIDDQCASEDFRRFLYKTSLRMEKVLVENELFNPFRDHVTCLIGAPPMAKVSVLAPIGIDSPTPTRLLHHAELCDGQFVSCLDPHPQIPGVLAAGYIAKLELEKRYIQNNSTNCRRHFVLIWKVAKLLEPTLILEAPDDITDVRFSVHDTHLIAATVHSGMILVWDVGQYESLLKGLPGTLSAEAGKLPTTYPVAATLENSSGIARHIQWVPSYIEFTPKGPIMADLNKSSIQLYAAYEGYITVWDLRITRHANLAPKDQKDADCVSEHPHLPKRMKSIYKVFPSVRDKRKEVAVSCFIMIDPTQTKPPSTEGRLGEMMAATLPLLCIAGTDEGEVFMVDWKTCTDVERGAAAKANTCMACHDGPVTAILPSPLINNLCMSIGGKIWSLWRASNLEGPLIEFPPRSAIVTAAAWSPWQPSVIVLGLSNGVVEAWDVLASTTQPTQHLRISKFAISAVGFGRDEGRGFFLSVADASGAGNIKLIPFPVDRIRPKLADVKKTERMFSQEMKHRLNMSQLLDPSAPVSMSPPAKVPDKKVLVDDKLKSIPAPSMKQYIEAFFELEKAIVHDCEDLLK